MAAMAVCLTDSLRGKLLSNPPMAALLVGIYDATSAGIMVLDLVAIGISAPDHPKMEGKTSLHFHDGQLSPALS